MFYKSGKDNRATDTLILQEDNHLLVLSFPTSTLLQELCDYYTTTTNMYNWLQWVSSTPNNSPCYQIHYGLLYFKERLFILPIELLRSKLLQEFHSSTRGGHSGITTTIQWINESFFGPTYKKRSLVSLKNVWSINKQNSLHNNPIGSSKHYLFPASVGISPMDFITHSPTSNRKYHMSSNGQIIQIHTLISLPSTYITVQHPVPNPFLIRGGGPMIGNHKD